MSERVLHGEIQRALRDANEVCARFKINPDGATWENTQDGWKWHEKLKLPTPDARAAFLWGKLDEG